MADTDSGDQEQVVAFHLFEKPLELENIGLLVQFVRYTVENGGIAGVEVGFDPLADGTGGGGTGRFGFATG